MAMSQRLVSLHGEKGRHCLSDFRSAFFADTVQRFDSALNSRFLLESPYGSDSASHKGIP